MRDRKKVIFVGVIKTTVFLLIFLILFQGATDLFRDKSDFYSVSPIYALPENTVDVLLIGTSHMACTISPMDLWKDYGITSFNAAITAQAIPETYFELRELLRVQKPKVVVMEIFYINQGGLMRNHEERLHIFVDNVPFSSGVHEAIQTLIGEEFDRTEYYLNFYSFHNRWKELSGVDFRPSLVQSYYNRGSSTNLYNHHSAVDQPDIVSLSETLAPSGFPLEYLNKIIELCRKEGIQLVFMVQPCSTSSTRQKMMNYVGTIAEKAEAGYINFFYLLEEIQFDFTKDIADTGDHVNYFGNQKLTSYLGEYLQTNYQLEDHRADPNIAELWNKDYETFARELNNAMMVTAENLDEYFYYLRNQDYIIAWNAYSEAPLSNTALPEILEKMEVETPSVKKKQFYCAITKGSQLLYKKSSDERPVNSYMAEDTLFSFGDGITGSTNPIGIHAGRTEYSVGSAGLNLVVYDSVSRTVVDKVNIDLETREIKRK